MSSDPTAPGLVLAPTATRGRDVTFGANVVVHDGVVLGDRCLIEDGVVLGKAPALAARSSAPRGDLAPLELGPEVTVGAQAVVFAGARVEAGAIIGDQAYVRERARVGAQSVVGRGCGIDNDVVLGERVRLQTQVYVAAWSTVEDDVFVGPCAMTTNDDTMARGGPDHPLTGATFRRGCRIGGGTVFVPGVVVGEDAFVAAGAVVTRDVAPRAVVMGNPARHVRDVPGEDLLGPS